MASIGKTKATTISSPKDLIELYLREWRAGSSVDVAARNILKTVGRVEKGQIRPSIIKSWFDKFSQDGLLPEPVVASLPQSLPRPSPLQKSVRLVSATTKIGVISIKTTLTYRDGVLYLHSLANNDEGEIPRPVSISQWVVPLEAFHQQNPLL